MPRLACVTLLALFGCAAGCSKPPADGDSPKAPVAEDSFTCEQAKPLIAEAAGIPSETVKELAEAVMINPGRLKEIGGETLFWWMMTHAFDPNGPANPTSFRFLSDQSIPSQIAPALSGPKDKDGNYRKTASVIHPEYITDCTCKVDGNTATGTVSFRAEKVYEGKIEYTARKKDGKWRIEEFRLPDYKTTLALGAGGKWVKK